MPSLSLVQPLKSEPLDPHTNTFNATTVRAQSKGLKLKNCYLQGTLSKDGNTREWKVVTTKFPWASKIYRFFKGLGKKTKFIADKEFESYAQASALGNKGEKGPFEPSARLDPIVSNQEFSAFLKRDVIEIKEARVKIKARWVSIADKVIKLTKGSNGPLGRTKMLDQHYWQEALHPSHAYGDGLSTPFQAWQASNSSLSFNDYLVQNNLANNTQQVKYLSKRERASNQVAILDGKLMQHGKILDTKVYMDQEGIGSSDFNPIYVISPQGEMYVGVPFIGEFHHSSFLSGAPILGAGDITTNSEGEITQISNQSGHYKPGKEQLISSLRYLESQGVDLRKVEVLERTDSVKIYKDAKAYLEAKGEIHEDGYVSDDAGKAYFDHHPSFTTLCLPDSQFSLTERANFCASLVSMPHRKMPTKAKVHLGYEAYVTYDIKEFVDQKSSAKVMEIEGASLEQKPTGTVLKINKKFENFIDKMKWTSKVVNLLIHSNQFDLESGKILEADDSYERAKTVSEFMGTETK